MRRILWIPIIAVSLILANAVVLIVQSAGTPAKILSALSSMEMLLLLVAECVLLGSWVVASELAGSRKLNQLEQEKTRNLLTELAAAAKSWRDR